MGYIYVILIIFMVWFSVHIIDKCLRQNILRYEHLLENVGITVSVCQMRWQTQRLNSFFRACSSIFQRRLKTWFNLGVILSVFAMLFSTAFLCICLIQSVIPRELNSINNVTGNALVTSSQATDTKLVPMLPGVNLPVNDVIYYFLALLISSVFHEMGHAVAAEREHVQVDSFGFIVLLIFPGAFVDIHTDHLSSVSPIRRLRIFCAGVWHNFILVISTYFLLKALPLLFLLLYDINEGVYVEQTNPSSSLHGAGGLLPGDVVKRVDDCRISNVAEWRTCLVQSYVTPSKGYCIPSSYIMEHESHKTDLYADTVIPFVTQCCPEWDLASKSCFIYAVSKPVTTEDTVKDPPTNYTCLPARAVITSPTCHSNAACSRIKLAALSGGKHDRSASPSVCVKPFVFNSTKLTQIHVDGNVRTRHMVIHLGDPRDIYLTVAVADNIPKYTWLPHALPVIIDKFCRYLIAISAALAVLNVAPCYALDGQYIVSAYLDMAMFRSLSYQSKRNICSSILFVGTTLVILNIIIALKPYVFNTFGR